MITHTCLRCVSGRCSKLIRYIGGTPRTYSIITEEKSYKLHCMPEFSMRPLAISRPHHTLNRSYSQVQNAEQVSREIASRLTDIPPVKFEDMSFDEPVSHDQLIAELFKCKTVAEQMQKLASTLALSSDDIQKRMNFCKTIESLLDPFFNNFKIQIFGSTVNYFGFKGCDIDMTFETTIERKERTMYLELPDIPLVSEVLSGKVSPQEISELPFKEQLLFIHTVLLEYYKESEHPAIFINAHVPLVRFHHDKFNLKCDLTFKNKVAYANTKMLSLFAKLDSRVIPLMMTLRFWAKHVEVVGKGLLFNTYTISLLVVYFLQSRDPPILPSAQLLLSLTSCFTFCALTGSFDCDMDDKSFMDIMDSIPPSKNTQNLDELLKEFFFFYLYFDFTRVVCPLTASSIPRDEFFSDEKNRKFRMNTICVQDPMCTRHNVAELVDYKSCKKFFHELMVACKIFQDNSILTPSTQPWGLIAILDKPEKYSVRNVAEQKVVSLTLPLRKENKHAQTVAETIHTVLQDVLLFECKPLELEQVQNLLKTQDELVVKQKEVLKYITKSKLEYRNLKKTETPKILELKADIKADESMLDDFLRLNNDYELVLCARCKASKNTWLGRDLHESSVLVNSSNSLLEKEHLISVHAAKQNRLNVIDQKIKPFLFLFECYTNNTDASLLVNFRPLQKMSFNPILGIFLKEYIPKIVKNLSDSS